MPELVINLRVAGASQVASQISPAGTAVQQLGQKAGGAVSPLNNVGTAAQNAGTKAQSAGGKFFGLGTRIAGVVGGIGLLAGGLFGLDNAFDAVEKADYRAGRASKTSKEATEKRVKAEEELAAAMGGGLQVMRNSNGEVSVQVKSTEELSKLKDNLADALENEALQQENVKIKTEEATEAHSQLFMQIMPNVAMMAAGASNMVAFGRGAGQMAGSATQAATGLGGMAKSGSGIPMMLAKIAIPAAAAVGAFLLLKNNVGGSRDALNSFGEAVGNAVPALRPVLNIFKGIGEALGIQTGPGISRVIDSFNLLKQQLTPFANTVREKLTQAAGSFKTFLGQISKGDISGAFGTLKDSAMALGGDIMGAIKSVNWGQVWQGLQDAFNSSVKWIRTAASSIGSAIGTTIKNWNWGDAWTSLQDAFWSSIDFLSNITLPPIKAAVKWILDNVWPALNTIWESLKKAWGPAKAAYNAAINWIIENVWPALQTVWHHLVGFWGQAKAAYHATIDWILKYIWPTLQQVWPTLVQWWGQAKAAYNATIDWAIKNIWPALQTVWATLVQWWGQAKAAYNATINWALKHIWPVLNDAVWATLRAVWGEAKAIYNAVVEFALKYVWPPIQEALASRPATWDQVILETRVTLKLTMERIILPAVDINTSGMINSINAAIKALPSLPSVTKGIRDWIFGLIPDEVAVSKKINVSGISAQPTGDIWANLKNWLITNMPGTLASAKRLNVTFAGIDWTGMRVAFETAARDMSAFFWNTISNEIRKASAGALNLPKISFRIEIEAAQIQRDLDRIKAQLRDPSISQERKIVLRAEAQDLISKLQTATTEIKKIPTQLRTTGDADFTKYQTTIDLAKKAVDSIPKEKKTTVSAADGGSISRIVASLNAIPSFKTVTIRMLTSGNAVVAASGMSNVIGHGTRWVPARVGPSGSMIAGHYESYQHGFGPAIVRKPTLFRAGEQGEEYVHIANKQQMSRWGTMRGGGQMDSQWIRQLIQLIRAMMMRGNDINVEALLNVDGYKMASNSSRHLGNRMYGERL